MRTAGAGRDVADVRAGGRMRDGCGAGIRFRPRGGAACGVSRIRTRAPRAGPPTRCGSAPELREACQGVTTHGQGPTEVGRSRTPPTEVGGCQRGADGWKSAEAGAARAWPQQGVPVSFGMEFETFGAFPLAAEVARTVVERRSGSGRGGRSRSGRSMLYRMRSGTRGRSPRAQGQSRPHVDVRVIPGPSPHVQGAVERRLEVNDGPGTTPARAGTRTTTPTWPRSSWDHPRTRGDQASGRRVHRRGGRFWSSFIASGIAPECDKTEPRPRPRPQYAPPPRPRPATAPATAK